MTGPPSRTSSVDWRGVVVACTTVCVRSSAVVSLRGPTSTVCSASRSSMSPQSWTRDAASRMRWSQTRSRSATRCEDSTTVSSPSASATAAVSVREEVPPGERVQRRDRLVEQQHPRPLGQRQRQRRPGRAGRRTACRPRRSSGMLRLAQPGPRRRGVPARVQVRAGRDVVLGGEPPVQRDLLGEEADLARGTPGPAAARRRARTRVPAGRRRPARRASAAAWSCPRRSARRARRSGPRAP